LQKTRNCYKITSAILSITETKNIKLQSGL